jgi:hypothetical protein
METFLGILAIIGFTALVLFHRQVRQKVSRLWSKPKPKPKPKTKTKKKKARSK